MIRITFTPEHLEQLRYERFHHPHPRVQQKMEALLLKSQGLPHRRFVGSSASAGNTLRGVFPRVRGRRRGGIEAVELFTGSQGELAAHRTTLDAYFREHPPATIKEAVAKIEELTGIQRGETQVRQFSKSIGMRRLKVGFVPAKADVEEQERFKKEKLEPRLGEAQAGRRVVFFVDAAHFVLAPVSGIPVVFRAAVGPCAGGPSAVQRAGRVERHDP